MPSCNPKPPTTPRPSPKERAIALRAAAPRSSISQPGPADAVPPLAQPNPALVKLIREHNELLTAGNSDAHSEAISDTLINRSFELFHEACAIPAAAPADLMAKFGLIEPELRDATSGHGAMADSALDTLAADLKRVLHAESLRAPGPAKTAAEHDLSKCTLHQLFCLQEALRSVWHLMSAETQAPWCRDEARRDHNAGGHVLDAETERLGRLADEIAREARRRTPDTEDERDDRLTILVRHELSCEGRIRDQPLLFEIARKWEAATRG